MKKLITLLLALAMVFSLVACGGQTADTSTEEPTQNTEEAAQAEEAGEAEEPAETDSTADADPATEAEDSSDAAEPAESEETAAETVSFTDDCGRTVELPADITRVVPTGGLAQVALFALVPERFVALSSAWSDAAKDYIDPVYLDLPVLGSLYGSADLNLEELAATDPQVIIDIGEAKKTIVEDMDAMQDQTSIPSIHIDATLSSMADAYRKLGALLGCEEKAEQIATFCERVYNRTLDIMNQVGDNKVNALFVLGEEGLNVIANGSFHAEVFDLLTNNLAVVESPSGKGSGNEVTMEQLALWDPDFIVFGPESIYGSAAEMDTWKDMKAISSQNYVEVPYGPDNWMGMPPSVQRYLSLIWLTAVLYPDYCDYDVVAEVKECYNLLYSCDLTDEQYAELTKNAFLAG